MALQWWWMHWLQISSVCPDRHWITLHNFKILLNLASVPQTLADLSAFAESTIHGFVMVVDALAASHCKNLVHQYTIMMSPQKVN